MAILLALDEGTSSCRTVAFDEDGEGAECHHY